ncbi:MAG: LamG domain-containing protein [Myxococcales bacterium]|nr:MAG: LamG domain-containing protein [Myxococcales bacterium]
MPLGSGAGATSGGSSSSAEGGSGDVGAGGDEGGGGDAPSPLAVSLLHRYSFDGEGDVALDPRGTADGKVVGTTLGGDGTLPLAGAKTGQFLNLPNRIVSGLIDATFESWLTWHGGSAWQRIFDFGSNSAGEDAQGSTGVSYLFFTAFSPADTGRQLPAGMRLVYSQNGVEDEEVCTTPSKLPADVPVHVAVVIDSRARTMSIYQDGALQAECALSRPLSAIDDVNNWLGHSNYEADVDLSAVYDEFRIYGAPLTGEQLAASFAAGPNATP